MRVCATLVAMLSAGLFAYAPQAVGEDNQAGLPLAPSDAAGAWTLSSGGHDICVVTLTGRKSGAGYAAEVPGDCAADLPGSPSGWQPTADGMRFTGANGAPLTGFNRWSNSLFVSHRASGVDLQLRRGRGPVG